MNMFLSKEKTKGNLKGVITQFGGQTPIKRNFCMKIKSQFWEHSIHR